jgi:hypothetical protein
MMKVIKGLGIFVGLICSLLVFTVVCLVAINATDRTKSPNTLLVENWLKQQPIDPSENGYEYAITIVGTIGDDKTNDKKPLISFSEQEVELTDNFKTACYQTDLIICSQFISDNSDSIRNVIGAHKANIQQYNTLLDMPYWQEEPQSLTPNNQAHWGLLFKLRDVRQLAAIISIDTSDNKLDQQATVAFLNKDAHFWNMVYHSSRSTLNHMIAVNMIKYQLNLASTLAKTTDAAVATKVTAWQTSFELTDSDFERIFSGEWLFAHNVTEQMLIEVQSDSVAFYEKWLAYALLKPTDSDNLMAEYIVSLVKEPVSTTSMHTLKEPNYCANDNYFQQLWMLRYNPIGKLFNCTVYGTDYKQRLTNMNTELEQLRTNLLTAKSS